MVPKARPFKPVKTGDTAGGGVSRPDIPAQTASGSGFREGGAPDDPTSPAGATDRTINLTFTANRDSLHGACNALANRADLADRVIVSATATSEDTFDRGVLENGIVEPLGELGLIDD